MKIEDLEGAYLNYWVARAKDMSCVVHEYRFGAPEAWIKTSMGPHKEERYCPSSDWNVGGLLLEEHLIGVDTWQRDAFSGKMWAASFSHPVSHPDTKRSPSHHRMRGSHPLVAAMRTLVASVYGDEVPEIPESDLSTYKQFEGIQALLRKE